MRFMLTKLFIVIIIILSTFIFFYSNRQIFSNNNSKALHLETDTSFIQFENFTSVYQNESIAEELITETPIEPTQTYNEENTTTENFTEIFSSTDSINLKTQIYEEEISTNENTTEIINFDDLNNCETQTFNYEISEMNITIKEPNSTNEPGISRKNFSEEDDADINGTTMILDFNNEPGTSTNSSVHNISTKIDKTAVDVSEDESWISTTLFSEDESTEINEVKNDQNLKNESDIIATPISLENENVEIFENNELQNSNIEYDFPITTNTQNYTTEIEITTELKDSAVEPSISTTQSSNYEASILDATNEVKGFTDDIKNNENLSLNSKNDLEIKKKISTNESEISINNLSKENSAEIYGITKIQDFKDEPEIYQTLYSEDMSGKNYETTELDTSRDESLISTTLFSENKSTGITEAKKVLNIKNEYDIIATPSTFKNESVEINDSDEITTELKDYLVETSISTAQSSDKEIKTVNATNLVKGLTDDTENLIVNRKNDIEIKKQYSNIKPEISKNLFSKENGSEFVKIIKFKDSNDEPDISTTLPVQYISVKNDETTEVNGSDDESRISTTSLSEDKDDIITENKEVQILNNESGTMVTPILFKNESIVINKITDLHKSNIESEIPINTSTVNDREEIETTTELKDYLVKTSISTTQSSDKEIKTVNATNLVKGLTDDTKNTENLSVNVKNDIEIKKQYSTIKPEISKNLFSKENGAEFIKIIKFKDSKDKHEISTTLSSQNMSAQIHQTSDVNVSDDESWISTTSLSEDVSAEINEVKNDQILNNESGTMVTPILFKNESIVINKINDLHKSNIESEIPINTSTVNDREEIETTTELKDYLVKTSISTTQSSDKETSIVDVTNAVRGSTNNIKDSTTLISTDKSADIGVNILVKDSIKDSFNNEIITNMNEKNDPNKNSLEQKSSVKPFEKKTLNSTDDPIKIYVLKKSEKIDNIPDQPFFSESNIKNLSTYGLRNDSKVYDKQYLSTSIPQTFTEAYNLVDYTESKSHNIPDISENNNKNFKNLSTPDIFLINNATQLTVESAKKLTNISDSTTLTHEKTKNTSNLQNAKVMDDSIQNREKMVAIEKSDEKLKFQINGRSYLDLSTTKPSKETFNGKNPIVNIRKPFNNGFNGLKSSTHINQGNKLDLSTKINQDRKFRPSSSDSDVLKTKFDIKSTTVSQRPEKDKIIQNQHHEIILSKNSNIKETYYNQNSKNVNQSFLNKKNYKTENYKPTKNYRVPGSIYSKQNTAKIILKQPNLNHNILFTDTNKQINTGTHNQDLNIEKRHRIVLDQSRNVHNKQTPVKTFENSATFHGLYKIRHLKKIDCKYEGYGFLYINCQLEFFNKTQKSNKIKTFEKYLYDSPIETSKFDDYEELIYGNTIKKNKLKNLYKYHGNSFYKIYIPINNVNSIVEQCKIDMIIEYGRKIESDLNLGFDKQAELMFYSLYVLMEMINNSHTEEEVFNIPEDYAKLFAYAYELSLDIIPILHVYYDETNSLMAAVKLLLLHK